MQVQIAESLDDFRYVVKALSPISNLIKALACLPKNIHAMEAGAIIPTRYTPGRLVDCGYRQQLAGHRSWLGP